jgi:hypothetical protein
VHPNPFFQQAYAITPTSRAHLQTSEHDMWSSMQTSMFRGVSFQKGQFEAHDILPLFSASN